MTRIESLTARKQLLINRIKQGKNYMSNAQIQVLRKRIQRYNQVLKLFQQQRQPQQLSL